MVWATKPLTYRHATKLEGRCRLLVSTSCQPSTCIYYCDQTPTIPGGNHAVQEEVGNPGATEHRAGRHLCSGRSHGRGLGVRERPDIPVAGHRDRHAGHAGVHAVPRSRHRYPRLAVRGCRQGRPAKGREVDPVGLPRSPLLCLGGQRRQQRLPALGAGILGKSQESRVCELMVRRTCRAPLAAEPPRGGHGPLPRARVRT